MLCQWALAFSRSENSYNKILYEAIIKCDYTKTKQVANVMYHKLV